MLQSGWPAGSVGRLDFAAGNRRRWARWGLRLVALVNPPTIPSDRDGYSRGCRRASGKPKVWDVGISRQTIGAGGRGGDRDGYSKGCRRASGKPKVWNVCISRQAIDADSRGGGGSIRGGDPVQVHLPAPRNGHRFVLRNQFTVSRNPSSSPSRGAYPNVRIRLVSATHRCESPGRCCPVKDNRGLDPIIRQSISAS